MRKSLKEIAKALALPAAMFVAISLYDGGNHVAGAFLGAFSVHWWLNVENKAERTRIFGLLQDDFDRGQIGFSDAALGATQTLQVLVIWGTALILVALKT